MGWNLICSKATAEAVILACLAAAGNSAAAAAPAAPTLAAPGNGAPNWLFSLNANGTRQAFSWNSSSGATRYEFVLGTSDRFPGFDDANARCNTEDCKLLSTTGTAASAAALAGFVFEPRTYYWKVRAVSSQGRSAWSSVRNFTTSNREAVVSAARGLADSPTSRTDRADGKTPTWLTELDVGTLGDNIDGALLSAAWNTYGLAKAPRTLDDSKGPTALRKSMRTNLTRQAVGGVEPWKLAEIDKLIDRIAAKNVPASLPRNALLEKLGIRAQCKEFADRMVIAGGGTSKTYKQMDGSATLDVRPGMYVARYINAHAAIVNAVRFDANGAVSARLSEANWASTWGSNPIGEVPWSRTVKHTNWRVITTTGEWRAHAN